MADTYLNSPRRISANIRLHAGEVMGIICQQVMLAELTEEELKKLIEVSHLELNRRENERK